MVLLFIHQLTTQPLQGAINSSIITGSNTPLNHYREQYTAQPLQGAINGSTIKGSNIYNEVIQPDTYVNNTVYIYIVM